jgi:hypothetical protein
MREKIVKVCLPPQAFSKWRQERDKSEVRPQSWQWEYVKRVEKYDEKESRESQLLVRVSMGIRRNFTPIAFLASPWTSYT